MAPPLLPKTSANIAPRFCFPACSEEPNTRGLAVPSVPLDADFLPGIQLAIGKMSQRLSQVRILPCGRREKLLDLGNVRAVRINQSLALPALLFQGPL